jgi:hypothetical protein
LSSTEGYPNQTPTSQQLIGSKNSLGIFTSKRSLCMPAQRNQKSKAASVGGFFHLNVIPEAAEAPQGIAIAANKPKLLIGVGARRRSAS